MKIKELTLYTHLLRTQEHFYTEILGFELVETAKRHFTVKIGTSLLTFRLTKQQAIYHFAFNIPSNATNDALKWLKERVEIVLTETGKEVADFDFWNAEAIYFKDPAGNILECIARKNRKTKLISPFSSNSIDNISEMGMPVADVNTAFENIHLQTNIPAFGEHSPTFFPCGDEEGLFILVDAKKKKWYPTDLPALPFSFRIDFEVKQKAYHLDYSMQGLRFGNAISNTSKD